MAEDSAAATDSEAMVISMAVDSAAGISSTVAAEASSTVAVEASSMVAAEADPVVVVPTAADIADRASTFRFRTDGWRLRQPFFFADLRLPKSASTQSAQKANQDRFLLGCCS
jgi:hypothetical protein